MAPSPERHQVEPDERERASTKEGTESSAWMINLSKLKPSQYALLALLALYAPSAIGHGVLFDPYLQLLLFVSLLFGSLLVSTTNLAGPLRYAYYNYGELTGKAFPFASQIGTTVTGWAPLPFLVLALLPWFRTWFFMGIMPVAWQYVREEHLQRVRYFSNRLDEWCAQAEVAAKKARSDLGDAERYRDDLEQNLRAADFYNTCLLGQITTVQGGALAARAKKVADVAAEVDRYLGQVSKAAQSSVEDAGKTQNRAVEAKTAVREGRRDRELELEVAVADARRTALEASDEAAARKEKVRTLARDAYRECQSVCEAHRQAVNSFRNKVDKYCSDAQAAVDKALSDADTARQHMHRLEQNLRADDLYSECSAAYLARAEFPGRGATVRAVPGATLAKGVNTTTTAAETVAADAVEASKAAQQSLQLLREVQHAAVGVKTAAGEGQMEGLEGQVQAAEAKRDAAIKASNEAAAAEEKARGHARNTHLLWLLTREEHAKEVAQVASAADKACIRAVSLAGQARAELGAAERLENTAHALVANVVRDARTAHDVWLSDFYKDSEAARRKLGDYHDIVRQAADSTSGWGEAARDLQSRAARILKPDEAARLKDAADKTKEARHQLQDLQQKSESIRREFEQFQLADAKAQEGREMQTKAAKAAADTLEKIAAEVGAVAEAARKAAEHADEVRQSAVDAKAAAALGGAAGAGVAVAKLNKALQACKEQFEKALNKRKEVQAKMVQFARDTYLP